MVDIGSLIQAIVTPLVTQPEAVKVTAHETGDYMAFDLAMVSKARTTSGCGSIFWMHRMQNKKTDAYRVGLFILKERSLAWLETGA